MKTNKTTNILLIILVVVIVIVAGVSLSHSNSASPVATTTTTTDTTSNTDSSQTQNGGTQIPTQISTASDTKLYADASFGFNLNYPNTYNVTSDAAGDLVLSVPGSAVPITIAKSTNSVTDSNGKWGPYTISYTNGNYVVQQVDEQTGKMTSVVAVPVASTASGLPVFKGGIPDHGFGTYDYIVALSHTKFLKISGPDTLVGSSYDGTKDPTFAVVKTITN